MLKVYACYPRRRTLWTQNGAQITVVATLYIYGSDRQKSQLPSDGHSVRSTRTDISYIIAHPPAYMTGECTKTLQKVWLLKEK